MKTRLHTLEPGDTFRLPEESTTYKVQSVDVSEENGTEVSYTSTVNNKRFIRKGYGAMVEILID